MSKYTLDIMNDANNSMETMGESARQQRWANTWESQKGEREKYLAAKDSFDVLRENGIIPAPEILAKEKFVFLATCSGGANLEERIARELDKELAGLDVKVKPLIIASDYAHLANPKGEHLTANPPDMSFPKAEEFKNVIFEFIVANALILPLPDESADIVYENWGQVFYGDSDTLTKLFDEYDRVLKPDGKIVIRKDSLDIARQRLGDESIDNTLYPYNQAVIKKGEYEFVVLQFKSDEQIAKEGAVQVES